MQRYARTRSRNLVLAGSLLARFLFTQLSQQPILSILSMTTYQLLQIPPANLHIALILIQALSELLRIHITTSRAPVVLLARRVTLSSDAVILRLFLGINAR